MKQYIHKKTGTIADQTNFNKNLYYLTVNGGSLGTQSKDFIEDSNDWEEITKPKYTILSLIGIKVTEGIILKEKKEIHAYIKNISGNKYWTIHSVRRESDGEVFTIGDTIDGISHRNVIINRISQEGASAAQDFIIFNWKDEGILLQDAKKSKQPLFTTEDGVDIYEGDKYWYVYRWGVYNKTALEGTYLDLEDYYFSSKEKAEEFILINKPCLSLNDILEHLNSKRTILMVTSSLWENIYKTELETLVKQKLK